MRHSYEIEDGKIIVEEKQVESSIRRLLQASPLIDVIVEIAQACGRAEALEIDTGPVPLDVFDILALQQQPRLINIEAHDPAVASPLRKRPGAGAQIGSAIDDDIGLLGFGDQIQPKQIAKPAASSLQSKRRLKIRFVKISDFAFHIEMIFDFDQILGSQIIRRGLAYRRKHTVEVPVRDETRVEIPPDRRHFQFELTEKMIGAPAQKSS